MMIIMELPFDSHENKPVLPSFWFWDYYQMMADTGLIFTCLWIVNFQAWPRQEEERQEGRVRRRRRQRRGLSRVPAAHWRIGVILHLPLHDYIPQIQKLKYAWLLFFFSSLQDVAKFREWMCLGHVSVVCGARDNMNGFGQPSREMRARNPGITFNDVPITHARRCHPAWPFVTRAAVV